MKVCSKCDVLRPITDFYKTKKKTKDGRSYHCKFCSIEATRKWRANDPDGTKAKKHRERVFLATRKITVEQRRSMLEAQNFKCVICSSNISDQPDKSGKATAKVDHCHSTQKIRGLLCNHCNTGLGSFRDSPAFLKNAISYLENAT